jgi:LPXTG-motif cell wall-anchored protein
MRASAILRTIGAASAAAGLSVLALAPSASAQTPTQDLVLLRGSTLVRVAADAPGTAKSTVTITGLGSGDDLLGIDARPSNGELYGIGETGVIYTINPTTGAATAGPTAATAPSGSNFGVDFNPAADRLRVISDTGQSLRINVADGVTTVDGTIAYAAADAGTGTTPRVVAAAYTNNDTDPNTATELFDLEAARDVLALQSPPNDGVLVSRGALLADVTDDSAFDIGPGNDARAVIGGTLVRVDLATGATTVVGAVTGGAVDGMAFLLPTPAPANTTTTTTTAPGVTTTTTKKTELPRTGSEDVTVAAVGALLLTVGGLCLRASAKRQSAV